MNCPLCQTPMDAGNLTIRGTGVGFLFFGLSYQHCWFEPLNGPSQVVVSNKLGARATHPSCGAFREAFHCSKCLTLIAPGELKPG